MNTRLIPGVLMACLLLGCAPDISLDPPAEPNTVALFDAVTGQLPLPNYLLKDPSGPRMSFPMMPPPGGDCSKASVVCDDECSFNADDPCADAAVVYDGALTLELKAGMNQLDGFINSMAITMPFSKALDPDTLTEDSVLLYDIRPVYFGNGKPVRIPAGPQAVSEDRFGDGYWRIIQDEGQDAGDTHLLTLKPKAPSLTESTPWTWQPGGMYAVAVTDSVKGTDGTPVESDLLLYLLRSQKPLIDVAKGVALNFLLQAQIDAGVLTFKEAISLETLRGNYNKLLNAIQDNGGPAREDVPLFFLFSVASNPIPRFGPQVGLGISFPGGLNPEPNEYGGSQDPVAVDAARIYFDPPPLTDLALKAEPTIQLFDITSGRAVRQGRELQFNQELTVVEVRRNRPEGGTGFEAGHRYAVVMTATTHNPAAPIIAGSTYWGLVAAENPLVDAEGNAESLLLDSRLDVLIMLEAMGLGLVKHLPPAADEADWAQAASMLEDTLADLEAVRQRMDVILDMIEDKDPSLRRQDLALAFTFTAE